MTIHFISLSSPQPYLTVFEKMQEFTRNRVSNTPDEIWFLEHQPVFTQGQAGRAEHVLNPGSIPIIQSDRGGQVTYHGPGQLMVYCLLDLKRLKLGVRQLVMLLENSFIELLESFQLNAMARCDAPGVYLKETSAKIASVGIRIRKGCSYHGVSFNLTNDLSPFQRINPCGFKNLALTRLSDHHSNISRDEVEKRLKPILLKNLLSQVNTFRESIA